MILHKITLSLFVPDLPSLAFLSQYSGFDLDLLAHLGFFRLSELQLLMVRQGEMAEYALEFPMLAARSGLRELQRCLLLGS